MAVIGFPGSDSSGNNNIWIPLNISTGASAGAAYDIMVDSPTNVFTSATDVGGVVDGNYCVLNAIDQAGSFVQAGGLSWGSSSVTAGGGNSSGFRSTIGVTTGKWYAEFTKLATSNNGQPPGVGTSDIVLGAYNGYLAITGGANTLPSTSSIHAGYDYTRVIGVKIGSTTASNTDSGVSFTTNDVLGYALDCDAKTLIVYKNGSQIGSTLSWNETTPSTPLHFFASQYQSWDTPCLAANFGQRPFTHTPPSGYKSINTTNLQALGTSSVGKAGLQPNKWFDVSLYGGTGVAQTIANGGFAPDLILTKCRSHSMNWDLHSTGFGNSAFLQTNTTNEVNNSSHQYAITPTNTGYTIDSYGDNINQNGRSFVSYRWKQSPTSGFNTFTYTGNSTAGRTISHNLGVAPEVVMIRYYDYTGADWAFFHKDMGWNYSLYPNTTAQKFLYAGLNNTAPTSSSITLGTNGGTNATGGNYIAWLWASVPGFSKFGSYIGNGSANGTFVYCGFKPRWIIVKDTNYGEQWFIHDTMRDPVNPTNHNFWWNNSGAEDTYAHNIDILSNGFKLRQDSYQNYNNVNYIYMAFAENPFALNNRAA